MESLAIHTVTSRSTSANEEAEELPDSEDVGRTETRDSDTDNEAEVGTDTTDLEGATRLSKPMEVIFPFRQRSLLCCTCF